MSIFEISLISGAIGPGVEADAFFAAHVEESFIFVLIREDECAWVLVRATFAMASLIFGHSFVASAVVVGVGDEDLIGALMELALLLWS